MPTTYEEVQIKYIDALKFLRYLYSTKRDYHIALTEGLCKGYKKVLEIMEERGEK